jgi:hypothetical protein
MGFNSAFKGLILLSRVLQRLQCGQFPSDFLTKTPYAIFSPTNAACSAYLILVDFIVLTTYGEVKIMKLLIA